MIFTGNKPQFVITNKITISNCIWNLSGLTNTAEHVHFSLNGGTFECNKINISSFDKSTLIFLRCSSVSEINCSLITFKNIKIGKALHHFDFRGKTDFTNSVYLIYYNYLFYFRFLKM
jgi:hypothetical protein